MDFAQKLRYYRKLKNMSQKELADRIDVSSRMIQKYESGESYPREVVLRKLSKVLSVEPEFFIVKEEGISSEYESYVTVIQNILRNPDIPEIDREVVYSAIIDANSMLHI